MIGNRSRLVIALGLAGLVMTCVPAVTRGQSFGFAVGSGGHHHHHGGWAFSYGVGPYWGPGWGPGWYGPPPIIYAPPPVVQPIYVQPTTIAVPPPPAVSPYTSSASPPGPPVAANTVPTITASNSSDDRIVIRNTSGANLPVSFLVDSQDVELPDGGTRTFVGKSHRTIQYDRGGRFGSTQQELTGGQYEFRVTASGWDLVRKPDVVSSRTAVRANSLPDSGVSR
jgi:hypothetical protein